MNAGYARRILSMVVIAILGLHGGLKGRLLGKSKNKIINI